MSVGGSVTYSDVAFSHKPPQRGTFSNTGGTWSTTIGGTSITHSETCTQSGTTACASAVAGLTGLWTTRLQNGGGAAGSCDESTYSALDFATS